MSTLHTLCLAVGLIEPENDIEESLKVHKIANHMYKSFLECTDQR